MKVILMLFSFSAILLAHEGHPIKTDSKPEKSSQQNTRAENPAPTKYTHIVHIQPFLVAKKDGTKTSNPEKNFVSAATQKIMNQAGIKLKFLPAKIYKNDAMWAGLFNGKHNVEEAIKNSPAIKELHTINLFFVNQINPNGKTGGIALEGGNVIFIAEWALKKKVQHVIAHELCHNLGLGHENFGANASGDRKLGKNVMYGVEPYQIQDIFPDGKKLSQINQQQTAAMLKHPAARPIDPKTGEAKILLKE